MTEPVVYTGVEPSVDDVIIYTGGRLEDDDATARLLAAALSQVRSYCCWHVTPVKVDHEVTLDGPGTRVLELPTGLLLELSELTEDTRALDVDTLLDWSADGLVRKKSGAFWSRRYRGITATMTHGYDTPPPDWVEVVLTMVDRLSMNVGQTQSTMNAGPYSVGFFPTPGKALDDTMRQMLEPYRLHSVY